MSVVIRHHPLHNTPCVGVGGMSVCACACVRMCVSDRKEGKVREGGGVSGLRLFSYSEGLF